MTMQKIEFEFPDPDGEAVEVESSNMEQIEDKPPSLKNLPAEKEDKVEVEVESDLDIEIVDDTPEADRNRTPSEPPEDVTDEELHDYSEKVQKRIKHISKGYHDERRAKEAAAREAEEARLFAKQILEENNRLKATVGQSRTAMLGQAKNAVTRDIQQAETAYKAAYESGDADKVLKAQDQLMTAKNRQQQIAMIEKRVSGGQTTETPVQAPQEQAYSEILQQQPEPDERARSWANKNTWFGHPAKEHMTQEALSYHSNLVNDGVDPTSDEYYEKLNSRMRSAFPDEFEGVAKEPTEPRSRSQVVAPATRSTAPRKVKLSQTQVNLAKRLGVPLEEYARQAAVIERDK